MPKIDESKLEKLLTELIENQNSISQQLEEVIEKLDNLSRPGSDYSIDE